MIEWIIIGGILVGVAAAGGLAGYAAGKSRGYKWTLAFNPYWNSWVWVPVFY
jgi:hypothetical protein